MKTKLAKKTPKKPIRKGGKSVRTHRHFAGTSKSRQTKPFRANTGDSTRQRLQKVLAAAGFGSRRACEELIVTGRVEVDRKVVDQIGFQVDPNLCEIRVDGQILRRPRPTYIALFKPKGYLCTNRDEQGRRRAVDLIPESFGRLFPVGRLDMNSDGLLLLTNDGELAERLTHPRYGVPKVYRVQVAGTVDYRTVEQLQKGIYLAEGFVKAERVVIKKHHKQSTYLEITLTEGRNREIRRLLAHVRHKVLSLTRISIGPIKLGKMLPGDYRVLSVREVNMLKMRETDGKEQRSRPRRKTSKVASPK
jgi:23S rRNA pseudouridine2605 synthase